MDTGTPPVESLPGPTAGPLSSGCRILSGLLPVERLLVAGDASCLGTFSCRPGNPLFHVEAPSTAHCLVFSRTPVWIRHERGPRYVADATVATLHNRARVYRRWPIVDRGDRCDWIAYADDVVAEAVSRLDRPQRGRDPLWFPAEFVPISSRLYARQRQLFDRAAAGLCDGDAIDEAAMLLLRDVLTTIGPGRPDREAGTRVMDAVQHVRAVVASTPAAAPSLRILAREAEMSPFQLCRAFSRICGETMTRYRLRVRVLASLERLRAGERLVDVALAHGFSSHSHFGAAFRAVFGTTPTAWRGSR